MARDKITDRLTEAQQEQKLVRVHRRGLVGRSIDGYVLQVTGRWVVLQELEDSVYVDGYEAIRVKDITSVKWDKNADYIVRAVKVLGRPEPDFQIPEHATTRDVIEAAAARADLIGVHSEKYEGEPMWIGRLEGTRKKRFDLLSIDTDGSWEQEPRTHRYKHITRIEFGGRYYTALDRFGDAPPPIVVPVEVE